jgi:hypothetical protein
MSQVIA